MTTKRVPDVRGLQVEIVGQRAVDQLLELRVVESSPPALRGSLIATGGELLRQRHGRLLLLQVGGAGGQQQAVV